jgi:hypothetical protein
MRKLITLFTLIVLSVAALAWSGSAAFNEKSSITAVAQDYMEAYYTADAARMQHALHPDFHKRTLRKVNDHMEISEDSALSIVEGVRLGTGKDIPTADRVQKIEVLDVYRDAASVKVVTGRWIDYIHLTKLNGEWRVRCSAAIHPQVAW